MLRYLKLLTMVLCQDTLLRGQVQNNAVAKINNPQNQLRQTSGLCMECDAEL